jgi:hypothetical protein
MGFKTAWLDAVFLGEGETKAELFEHCGIAEIDAVRKGFDFVTLLETEIIHILASSNFDFLTVVFCVFAHDLVLLRWWG